MTIICHRGTYEAHEAHKHSEFRANLRLSNATHTVGLAFKGTQLHFLYNRKVVHSCRIPFPPFTPLRHFNLIMNVAMGRYIDANG